MVIAFPCLGALSASAGSGVYVTELIRNHIGGKILSFQANHAKPLGESLSYYMLAHPFNELMPPETINILKKHTTPGYFPWMHEQAQTSSDEIEDMMLFVAVLLCFVVCSKLCLLFSVICRTVMLQQTFFLSFCFEFINSSKEIAEGICFSVF